MQTDFLIIGQGICGTFLSWKLQNAGCSCIVIDAASPLAASRVAAGIINPVTGRRIVKTWLIDEILPAMLHEYTQLGNELGIETISRKDIVDFFPTPQMRNAFLKRSEEEKTYLSLPGTITPWEDLFNNDFGYGLIAPAYLVHLQELLPAWQRRLQQWGWWRNELFNAHDLRIADNSISYGDITASRIIFCDGIASFNNPWFALLPFAPNKGEALLIEIDGYPQDLIFKRGMNLVPWKRNIYWVGSSYEWEFEHSDPTPAFRERTELLLEQWLKKPFKVIDHLASVRPATIERRPFMGIHPLHPAIGIFNGMGTKGCSLAPFFAGPFVEHLLHEAPLHPEADVQRFRRILSKQ